MPASSPNKPPAIPTQVKIGAQVFDIVERSHKKDGMLNDDTYGYTLDKENLIVVDSDIHITKKQVTLLHEIMHACRLVFDNGVRPKKIDEFDVWEHYFIGAWETSLIMVFRDNPKVLAYLIWE
jgi:ribonucleotide reductase alpha subunit